MKFNYKEGQQYSHIPWSIYHSDSLEGKYSKLIYGINLAIHQENRIYRGWTHKNSNGYIANEIENISFSVIWASPDHWFYGIIKNPQKNTLHSFQCFLIKLMAAHKRIVNDSKRNYCIIYDNASIHKTKFIQSISIKSKITILTIPPFWHILNAAEKLILGTKRNIFKFYDQGRYQCWSYHFSNFRRTTFSLVAKIIDEIPISELKGYFDASLRES